MRKEFVAALKSEMDANEKIVVFSADLGYGMLDAIRSEYIGTRFYSFGPAEFSIMAIACGAWAAGKIPIFYSITPFALWRPAEILRLYLNHDKNAVKIVGGGRDQDYSNQGFTHDASDAKKLLDLLPNISQFWPESVQDLPAMTKEWLYCEGPAFLSLRR